MPSKETNLRSGTTTENRKPFDSREEKPTTSTESEWETEAPQRKKDLRNKQTRKEAKIGSGHRNKKKINLKNGAKPSGRGRKGLLKIVLPGKLDRREAPPSSNRDRRTEKTSDETHFQRPLAARPEPRHRIHTNLATTELSLHESHQRQIYK